MVVGSKIVFIAIGVVLGIIAAITIKNQALKSILNMVSTIIFICVIVVSFQKFQFNDNRFLFGYIFQLSSDSMANTLVTNDYVFVTKTNNYEVGDIVTFMREERTVTHRIIEIEGTEIITKGDSNFKEDEPITKDRIIGKVLFHGKLLNAFVNYLCFILIAFVTTFLVGSVVTSKPLKDNDYDLITQ